MSNDNGGVADNKTTMLEKNKNRKEDNQRKKHQQMMTTLSDCDSCKWNETTKDGNIESESEGETTKTVTKINLTGKEATKKRKKNVQRRMQKRGVSKSMENKKITNGNNTCC